MSISRAELQAFRGATLPDLIGPGLKLLFVDGLIDASTGLADEDREHLLARGVGITSLVAGATARGR